MSKNNLIQGLNHDEVITERKAHIIDSFIVLFELVQQNAEIVAELLVSRDRKLTFNNLSRQIDPLRENTSSQGTALCLLY